jgi:hypothetical protein
MSLAGLRNTSGTLAAYVLDPIFFQLGPASGRWSPPTAEFTAVHHSAILQVLLRVSAAKEGGERQALADEWSAFKLAALRADMCSDLPYLTKREESANRSVLISLIEARLGWWEKTANTMFPWLAKVAQALRPRHVTTCAAERNWSNIYNKAHNRLSVERADKLIFIAGNKGCANLGAEAREVAMDLLSQEGAEEGAEEDDE